MPILFGIEKMRSFFVILLTLSSILTPTDQQQNQQQQHQPIKTIVVLVLENRSFDHMLGWMKKSINPSINGVTGNECNSVSTNTTNSKKKICFSDGAEHVDLDPGHSFEAVEKQVFGSDTIPSMSGFAEQALSISQNLSETVMKGFNPASVPTYAALVNEFVVFDRWFSSIPGPTQPNRLFVYSATSQGSISHVKKQLAKGYPQKTIFQSIDENKLDFGIYYHTIPATLFYRKLRKLKYVVNKFHRYDKKFKNHATNGKLPSLSVIEPAYFDLNGLPANDDHPSHDVANGQKLVKDVYETLRASPQWNESLLIITYDEHGGFFDHVCTPSAGVPNPDGINGPSPSFFKFDRLGVRVPTIMVSPWIVKGTVISSPDGPTPNSEFEHSSIPATIKKVFNLSSNFLTHRDAWAGTFEQVVSGLTSPRTDCPVLLPNVVPLRKTETDENRGLSEFQGELVQLAAVLNGDHFLNSFRDEMGKKMNVKEAHKYVNGAVSRFIRASKEAVKLGADESTIVDMRSSLTTRSPIQN